MNLDYSQKISPAYVAMAPTMMALQMYVNPAMQDVPLVPTVLKTIVCHAGLLIKIGL